MTAVTTEDQDNLRAAALDRIAELVEDNLDDYEFLYDISDIAGVEYSANVSKEIQKILREAADEIQGLNF